MPVSRLIELCSFQHLLWAPVLFRKATTRAIHWQLEVQKSNHSNQASTTVTVTADLSTAFDWYRRASDAGSAHAPFNLGSCYANGTGVACDLREARRWFERAAAAGVAQATAQLAELDAFEAQ